MRSHYRKRFVPDSTIRARMDAADLAYERRARAAAAKLPAAIAAFRQRTGGAPLTELFPDHDDPNAPIVIRFVDLVPKPQPRGAVVDVALVPAETVPGCRVCLLAAGAIVELVALVCPTCGQDYR